MENPSREDTELNEARWWSNWARLTWLDSAGYLLTSGDFGEPFFNRACILNCRGVDATVAWAEERLTAQGTGPIITIFDSCNKAARGLRASGYRRVDRMTVMLSSGQGKSASQAPVTINGRPAADNWTRAYLEAFYGDKELAPTVTPIVVRLLKLRSVTLLEARTEGETAGVLAIFRTRGLAGVYCVGTIPEHRSKGVASALLSKATAMAAAEGRHLILQALASDVPSSFYLERGFRILYSKQMMSKESSNAK